MNYIDVKPIIIDDRLCVHIDMSDYEIQNKVEFQFVIRRNDGLYEKILFEYPSSKFKFNGNINVDVFSLYEGQHAQIVGVKANGSVVNVRFGGIPNLPDFNFRYDDSICENKENISGNVILDFQVIDSYDPKVLMIVDNSIWGSMKFEESIVEIVTPGMEDPIRLNWQKNKVNSFNSYILGLSCSSDCKPTFNDLSDGIYHIRILAEDGSSKERYYLKSDTLQLKIDKKYLDLGLLCEEQNKEEIENIKKSQFYLEAAESNMRLGSFCDSFELYQMAEKLVSNCNKCNK